MKRTALIFGTLFVVVACLPFTIGTSTQNPIKDPPKDSSKEVLAPILDSSASAALGEIKDIKARPPAGAKFSWQVPPQGGMSFRTSGDTLFFVGQKPGIYQIGFSWIDGEIKTVWCEVTVADGAGVGPPKPVGPSPPTGPIPLTVIIIGQTGDTAWMPTFFSSTSALGSRMTAVGHQWKYADRNGKDEKGQVVAEVAGWVQQSQIRPLPWVYVVDAQAKLLRWEGPLPVNPKAPEDPVGPANLLGIIIKAGG